MLHKIYLKEDEFIRELMKVIGIKTEEKEPSLEDISIFNDITDRIKELGVIENRARLEREMLSHFIDCVLKVFKDEKESDTPESSEVSEPKEKPEKIDDEAVAESDNPRRGILKVGIKRALNTYKKAPLSKRYRDPKRINKLLELSIKQSSGLTDNEHIVRMEAAIGEALTFLQNSPLATRSKSLMEARKILEETIDKKNKL